MVGLVWGVLESCRRMLFSFLDVCCSAVSQAAPIRCHTLARSVWVCPLQTSSCSNLLLAVCSWWRSLADLASLDALPDKQQTPQKQSRSPYHRSTSLELKEGFSLSDELGMSAVVLAKLLLHIQEPGMSRALSMQAGNRCIKREICLKR